MSQLAFFFHDAPLVTGDILNLSEDSIRHVVQVLRKKEGDRIGLCNGNGTTATCEITAVSKKTCSVTVLEAVQANQSTPKLSIAVAFTKNAARNEWLLEKATELGVAAIYPLVSERTEREKFREDRARNILISAMLQSQQAFLPKLSHPSDWKTILSETNTGAQKLLAHCDTQFERKPISEALTAGSDCLVFIGPEGDFSPDEIRAMEEAGFSSISLCKQRLRTETAAIAVCAHFTLCNEK